MARHADDLLAVLMHKERPSRTIFNLRKVMEKCRASREETRNMWAIARRSVLEAHLTRGIVRAQVYELSRDKSFCHRYQSAMLAKILRAAIKATSADMGNIRLLDPVTNLLKIQAQCGFAARFLDFFSGVESADAACGTALRQRRRVIVEDIANHDLFRGAPSLEVLLDADVRAVQSTPFFGTRGQVLGILSTHYRFPTQPSPRDLRAIDYYAQQAAGLVEWTEESGFALCQDGGPRAFI